MRLATNNILTLDGPTGVGKGTVGIRLAAKLKWHYLDSGMHYRLIAWLALRNQLVDNPTNEEIASLLESFIAADMKMPLDLESLTIRAIWEDQDITDELRSEETSRMASVLSPIPEVRQAVLAKQRAYATPPGLVADGRDMGTIVFPGAVYKIYLDAELQERAKRRYNQLKQKGIDVTLDDIASQIEARDERDITRHNAPLVPASDATIIDSTHMTIEQVCEAIMETMRSKGTQFS